MARDTLVPAGALLGDRYEVGECLGQGQLTAVHAVQDTELRLERVVRVLEPALSRTPRARDAFLDQARTLARVNHPGLVTVHDVGDGEDGVYCVMERLPGRVGPGRRLEPREAVPIARALALLHRSGGVHGRVRRDNLYRADDGGLVLGDSGIALAEGASPERDTADLIAVLELDLELTDAVDLAEALERIERPRPPLVPLVLGGVTAVLLLFGLGALLALRWAP